MTDYTAKALRDLGHYRVTRVQELAGQGDPDGISGSLLLALGLRETGLRNIEGGAKRVGSSWVREDDPNRMDVGFTQISRRFHLEALRAMPGVKAGTWAPTVKGKTAADAGYCPRFEEQIRFTLAELQDSIEYARSKGIPERDRVRFAVAAHNAGRGGAYDGYRTGGVDRHTANGDYSADVLKRRTLVNQWLAEHPNWRA